MGGAGIACAMPVAWALRRMVQAQLFGVGVFDAPTIAFASSGLGVVALGAALVPAWRAALVPPMVAIRDQPESMWHSARSSSAGAPRVDRRRRTWRRAVGDADREFTGMVQRAGSSAKRSPWPCRHCANAWEPSPSCCSKRRATNTADRLAPFRRAAAHQRLTHFPHPLPLTRGRDGRLAGLGPRAPARPCERDRAAEEHGRADSGGPPTKREIVGVLLLGAPEGRQTFTDAQKQVH